MSQALIKNKISVCTPTYNRAILLKRVYDSLVAQTYKFFEWIIVDDGSNDNTKEIVQKYIEENRIEIHYVFQDNGGKHNAVNRGVAMATGEFFVIADSDDGFVPESLQVMLDAWECIPCNIKHTYRGIACRCKDQYGNLVGDKKITDISMCTNELDVKYKRKLRFELWGMTRTEIMVENPFPPIKGLRFYPEAVIWDNISLKYKTKYINEALRIYYLNQEDSTTYANSITRYKENYYLWLHYINDIPDYLLYAPKELMKALIGISRDGFLNKKTIGNIMHDIDRLYMKALVLFFCPIGMILSKIG